MLTVSARDLQYRYRRFLIGVVITALVFGIVFIFDGVKTAVRNEATKTVELFDADRWVVADGAPGSFLSTAVIPADASEEIRATPGVERADPVVVSRTTLELDPELTST